MHTHSRREKRRRILTPFFIVIYLALVIPYLQIAFTTSDSRPVAPLDDAYITLQYARQIARGHIYRYNTGDPPTTGMTSMLYGFLMTGLYKLGFTGESLVGVAVALGTLWLPLNAWLTFQLTESLLKKQRYRRKWALAAALLVLLSGAAQWGCFNGMETGLFTAMTLAALQAFLRERRVWCVVWLSIAGMTRPEGLLLTGIILFSALVSDLLKYRRPRWRALMLLSLAILPGLLPSLMNWALTGSPSATGFQAKAWIYNVPAEPKEILRSMILDYRDIILGAFLGWSSPVPKFAPLGLLVFMLPIWLGLGIGRRWRALLTTTLWFFGAAFANAALITSTWHVGRYQLPLLPLAFSLALGSIAWLEEHAHRTWQKMALGIGVLYLFISALTGIPDFITLYQRSTRTMVNQQLVLADWMREHLPPQARVGVHDTGSLRYVGKRPTYDLVGLTTPKAAEAWRHGAGSVYELMEASPMRPDYFAIYPDAFSIPYLANTDLFAQELLLVNVPYAYIASAEPVQGIWKADWSLANRATSFYQTDILSLTKRLEVIDTVDVADLEDEAAHSVRWWQRQLQPGFPTEVHQMTYRVNPTQEVIDGGRLLNGGLSFQTTSKPGQPMWLVARLHAQQGGAVYVNVDGRVVGRWAYPQIAGEWLETPFKIPAEDVTQRETQITLDVDATAAGSLHYAPYYLWILQGDATLPDPEIAHRIKGVRFADTISLLGFDLPTTTWRPGETLPLTLYWQTAQKSSMDAKVFVHLYDAYGAVIAQADGRPYYGTRPPYTWIPDEIIVDPITLVLPDNIPPGHYTLKTGLYAPDGSGRLAAYQHSIPQDENRILLTAIEVQPSRQ